MRIGILALQGDFNAHVKTLKSLGHDAFEVRKPGELEHLKGLVIPGGESTTILKLLTKELEATILEKVSGGLGIFGTCAGLILISQTVTNPSQKSLNLLPITTERNSFGRQIDSFVTREIKPINSLAKYIFENQSGVFIRAPRIVNVDASVEVLATYENTPVLVRKGKIFGATFHPEISEESAESFYKFILREWS